MTRAPDFTVGLTLPWEKAPRTVFYDRFLATLRARPEFRAEGPARLAIPAEDTALETNWPRYGDAEAAFVRGSKADLEPGGAAADYLRALARQARAQPGQALLLLNLYPFVRLPALLADFANVVVADGSLSQEERRANPRTISLPALPMVRPAAAAPAGARPILAFFRGAASHPVRQALAALHDGREVVVELVPQSRHAGRFDPTAGRTDGAYEALIDASTFAFVPRGDQLFSYRLLEVMARGAIPVVLSDGWVLPFDRTVDWDTICVRTAEAEVADLPARLRAMGPDAVGRMQAAGRRAYEAVFADLERIVAALLGEAKDLTSAG